MDQSAGAGGEVFALTDEQIVGLDESVTIGSLETSPHSTPASRAESAERESLLPADVQPNILGTAPQTSPSEVPRWLAERMRDPSDGAAAKELWDGKQKTDAEVAAYREAFATPADARALKELYPGGVAEAKAAADRARELDTIDAAFYRGDAAARAQLARQLMQQDPAAFRAMVEVGLQLLHSTPQTTGQGTAAAPNPRASTATQVNPQQPAQAEPGSDVVASYRQFESTANAELEKSVSASIARAMEQALPNLRLRDQRTGEAGPLQDRLRGAVREEVDAALRNDRELGEQVTRILAGRNFSDSSRTQVVRLIEARAQQLVPGAVKRVVSSWTDTMLARSSGANAAAANTTGSHNQATPQPARNNPRATPENGNAPSRPIDYRHLSDEQILGGGF